MRTETGNSVPAVLEDLHSALEKDVLYYAPMGQRGPVIHTVVDYKPVVVPEDFGYDELRVFSHDDCELHSLDEMVSWALDVLNANEGDVRAFYGKLADASSHFYWSDDEPVGFSWRMGSWDGPVDGYLSEYEYEAVVDVLCKVFPDDDLEVMGIRYVRDVDRAAQFLTHAEAEACLRSGNYSPRAHTYCCHIPDDSLLARLLEAVGPVHR